MGEHGALGRAGGAGGVDDGLDVISLIDGASVSVEFRIAG